MNEYMHVRCKSQDRGVSVHESLGSYVQLSICKVQQPLSLRKTNEYIQTVIELGRADCPMLCRCVGL